MVTYVSIAAICVVLIVIGRIVYLMRIGAAFSRAILGYQPPRDEAEALFVNWINKAGTNRRRQRDMTVQLMKGLGGNEDKCANMIVECVIEAWGTNARPFGQILFEKIVKNIHFEETTQSTPEGRRQVLEMVESPLLALDDPSSIAA